MLWKIGVVKSIYNDQYRKTISLLVEKRKSLKISQADLGLRLGVDQTIVSKIETCLRRIDIIETIRICECLSYSIYDLISAISIARESN